MALARSLKRALRPAIRPSPPHSSGGGSSFSIKASPTFFHLPASIRTFHASSPRPFLEPVLQSSHAIFSALHSTTGLPWYTILPLSALSVRLLLTLPTTLITRKSTQQQLDLHPLLLSWSHQIRRDIKQNAPHLGPVEAVRAEQKQLRIKRRELFSRWNCGYWKMWLSLLQLPVWLVVMETVRGMCGAGKGLLGIMLGSGQEAAAAATTKMVVSATGAEISIDAGHLAAQVAVEDAARNALFEPSIATEGMLWFSDLSAPDPMLLLPFILSGSMLLNLMPSSRKALHGTTQTPLARRLTNILRVVALLIGPMTLQMPSAMLLYWISSSLMAFVQSIIISKVMPLRPPVQACRTRASRLANSLSKK